MERRVRQVRKAAVNIAGAALGLVTIAAAPSTPAAVPQVFAPGVISGPQNDADACITPDGKTLVFARGNTIFWSHRSGSTWARPEIAPFSGQWPDQQPTLAPDGSYCPESEIR